MRPVRLSTPAVVVLAWVALTTAGPAPTGVSVKSVEAVEGPDTVVKVHLSGPLSTEPHAQLLPKTRDDPDRLSVDLPGADMHGKPARSANVGWGGIRRIRLGMPSKDGARVVLDLDRPVGFELKSEGDVVAITVHDPSTDVILKIVPDPAPPAPPR
jgi:AMIN domain-containing protein